MYLIVLFLLILILPVGILLGLFDLSLKTLGVIGLFSLKYLLPPGIIGFLIARKKAQDRYFPTKKYLQYICIAMGAGFVLLLAALSIPVTPKFPASEAIESVSVSYEAGGETRTASTEDDALTRNLLQTLSNKEYKSTIREFIKKDDNCHPYTLTLTDAEGKDYTLIFCNYQVLGVQKGGLTLYYRVTGEHDKVPIGWAQNVFTLELRAESEAVWQPFAEELFSTVAYNEENQEITFVIPEVIPDGIYDIDLCIEGVESYTDGEFEPIEFYIYEEEQKQDSWIPGEVYYISISDVCFSRFDIMVNNPLLEEPYTFDVLSLLPENRVYK